MSAASQIRHPSPRDLALIALGDETPTPTERHLRDCPACRSALDSFLRVLRAGPRSGDGVGAATRPRLGGDPQPPVTHADRLQSMHFRCDSIDVLELARVKIT